MDWTPQNDLQAQDRIWRIGQKNKCTVYTISAKSPLDDLKQQLHQVSTKWLHTLRSKEKLNVERMFFDWENNGNWNNEMLKKATSQYKKIQKVERRKIIDYGRQIQNYMSIAEGEENK